MARVLQSIRLCCCVCEWDAEDRGELHCSSSPDVVAEIVLPHEIEDPVHVHAPTPHVAPDAEPVAHEDASAPPDVLPPVALPPELLPPVLTSHSPERPASSLHLSTDARFAGETELSQPVSGRAPRCDAELKPFDDGSDVIIVAPNLVPMPRKPPNAAALARARHGGSLSRARGHRLSSR